MRSFGSKLSSNRCWLGVRRVILAHSNEIWPSISHLWSRCALGESKDHNFARMSHPLRTTRHLCCWVCFPSFVLLASKWVSNGELSEIANARSTSPTLLFGWSGGAVWYFRFVKGIGEGKSSFLGSSCCHSSLRGCIFGWDLWNLTLQCPAIRPWDPHSQDSSSRRACGSQFWDQKLDNRPFCFIPHVFVGLPDLLRWTTDHFHLHPKESRYWDCCEYCLALIEKVRSQRTNLRVARQEFDDRTKWNRPC